MSGPVALRKSLRLEHDAGHRRKVASPLQNLAKLLAHVGNLAQQLAALLIQHILVEDLSGATASGLCPQILVRCEDDLDWEPSLVAGHANHPNAAGETASAQTSRRALKVVSA